ncbi:hypothetical protein ACTXT7_011995 [Hymenolepis weldensis]
MEYFPCVSHHTFVEDLDKQLRFYFRLYLYCVRLLHSSNWCAYIQRKTWRPRLYVFFNFLLWTLYVMQMIWSYQFR